MALKPLPIIVDKWSPTKEIEGLRDVMAINSLKRYEALEFAYRQDYKDQNWFYNILYQSGLFPVFAVFNVPSTNLQVIKELIDYNYAPTRPNLIILLDDVLPETSSYEIVEGTGEVSLTISDPNIPTVFNTINALTRTAEGDQILTDRITDTDTYLIEYAEADTVIAEQDTYILNLYVPCGVKLNLTITNVPLTMVAKDNNKSKKVNKKTKIKPNKERN